MHPALQGLITIILGVGGCLGYFYLANQLLDKVIFPPRLDDAGRNISRATMVRPWLFLFPAIFALGLYLAYPVFETLRLSLTDRSLFETAPNVSEWRADRDGTLRFIDVRAVGRAVSALGGGRAHLGDPIDPAVGLVFLHAEGDPVSAGDPICQIHHRESRGLEPAIALLTEAIEIGEGFEPEPLILARLGAS